MSGGKYILRGHEAVEVEDVLTWARWFESANRRVAATTIGDSEVLTDFLGLDHNFSHEGPPVVFETMVFGGPLNDEQDRYSTWAEAEAGHEAMVRRVTEATR